MCAASRPLLSARCFLGCRYLADAAPQRGEATMRSGRLDEAEPDVRRFKAIAERQMGDAAEGGDIAFG